MGRVRALNFYATERHHTPTWILKKIADLVDKGKRHEDSSSILYACLEARNLLEMISTTKLLCSVSDEDRARITAAVKPQNGIKGVNKELKALGLKTQEFMNAVCAVENQEFPVFNFTESDDIQHRLSQYIHTYAVLMADMEYGSDFINAAFPAIEEAMAFARVNLIYNPDRNTYAIGNLDVTTMPQVERTA